MNRRSFLGLAALLGASKIPMGKEPALFWLTTPPQSEGKYLVRNVVGRETLVVAARYPEIDDRLRVSGPYGMCLANDKRLKGCRWNGPLEADDE